MRVGIDYAQDHLELDVPEAGLIGTHREPPARPLADPAAAMRAALETPLGFPALRRALTPDDLVVIVLDEFVPQLPELLKPLLEHLTEAHVSPAAITLLCPQPLSSQDWRDQLPQAFRAVQIEVHDPSDRRHLSYLATTRHG